jgi:predicted DNA-binding protein (UPF0251 family)
MIAPSTFLSDHEAMVFQLCQQGKIPRRDIARQMEVSENRVTQIYQAAQRKIKDVAEHGEDALCLLPARVRRVVEDHGIGSRALARQAIESGRLSWLDGIGGIFWDGVMIRQVSRKTWAALYAWAGRPPLPKRDAR